MMTFQSFSGKRMYFFFSSILWVVCRSHLAWCLPSLELRPRSQVSYRDQHSQACFPFLQVEHSRSWNDRSHPRSKLRVASTTVSDNEVLEEQFNPSSETVAQDFLRRVSESIKDENFVSLTLRGPTVPKKGKHKGDKERLRGCVKQVRGRLIELSTRKKKKKINNIYLQATIKYHGATDVAKNFLVPSEIEEGLSTILMLRSVAEGGDVLLSEWGERGIHPCGSELGIQGGELVKTDGVWDLDLRHPGKTTKQRKKGPKLVWKKQINDKTTGRNEAVSHDRQKQVPLSSDASFFQALGLSKADGKPRPGMSSKLKQCQKFVEIVGGLVDSSIDVDVDTPSTIRTMDMGCGRGYLTFALHSYLYNKYRADHVIESSGIDVRPKLVKEVNGIARSLGTDFDGLLFKEGTIESVLLETSMEVKENAAASLDVLIALHACDTATDDALFSGIQKGSDILVVAPCCHKQVRRQLDKHTSQVGKQHPLTDVLRHNIYRERIAETVTDSVRALLLEIANYNVQVFEFIGGEHTSKNVMITAAKRKRSRRKTDLEELRNRLKSLCSLHGIQEQRLAKFMGEAIIPDGDVQSSSRLSSKTMPPL